jgi:hypothetical protein
MLAHGFTRRLLAGLVSAGLATARGKTFEGGRLDDQGRALPHHGRRPEGDRRLSVRRPSARPPGAR